MQNITENREQKKTEHKNEKREDKKIKLEKTERRGGEKKRNIQWAERK